MEQIDIATIKKRSVAGVLALTSRTFLLQMISLFSFTLLSAFLSESAIGVYVVVAAIMRLVSFFSDFGLGAAIVQKKEQITDEDLQTAFTIQFIITGLIFLVFLVFYKSVAVFFNLSADGGLLLLALIFTLFLSSFKTIPSVLLERELKFGKLIIPQIAENIVFNGILVYLAFTGFGVASYTYSTLAASIIGIPIYYLISPWNLRIGIKKSSLKILLYGTTFQAKSILGTIKDDLMTTFLAKLLTFSQIGLIGWGQKWAFFPFRFIVDSVTKVTFSAYSRLQHDKKELRYFIEKSIFTTSVIMFPVSAGLIITSAKFISFIPSYDKWNGALISLTFFSLNAAVSSISNILVNVLDSTGHVKTTFKLMMIWTVMTWTLTPVLIYTIGYNGVSIASFMITLTVFYTIYLVKKIVNFSLLENILPQIFASGVMSVLVSLINYYFVSNIVLLFANIFFGITIYTVVLYLTSKNKLKEFIMLIISQK